MHRQCEINIHTFAAPNYYELNQLRRAILQSLDRIQMYFLRYMGNKFIVINLKHKPSFV